MIFRNRIFITAALVCHLLVAPGIVTSQTPPPGPPSTTLPAAASSSGADDDQVTIEAVQQEKDGPVYHLRGQAAIRYRGYVLSADEITHDNDTGESQLEGHVVLDGGPYDEHVEASHGIYNTRTDVGTFYDVIGTAGIRPRRNRYLLTTSNPVLFTGKVVDKTGPDRYLVHQGTVTTCEMPRPKWLFEGHRIAVDVDGTAQIYRSDFRLHGVPVFYFPFATSPVQRDQRHTGLLIPSFGKSSTKGYIAGESAYWAIDRFMDATVGAEYFSKRGWSQRAEFRARPSDTSFVDATYFGVLDRGIGSPLQKQGGEEAKLNAEGQFGHNFRGVANVDYLSSFVFRIAFSEVYTQAVNSELKSQIFLSNTTNGFNYNGLIERYQNFEVCNPADVNQQNDCTKLQQTELVRILHTPSFLVSGDERRLEGTPLFWSFDGAIEGLQRRELDFRTAPLVGRFDFAPSLSMPLQWQGWSLRPELTLRDTFYTQSKEAAVAGQTKDATIDRKSLEAAFELRPPSLSKIFDKPWLGRRWKHVVETRLRYDYVTGVNNFANLVRFDDRDVLTNTNEVEYTLVNRLYSKRLHPDAKDCEPLSMSNLTIGGAHPVGPVPWEMPEPEQPNGNAAPCVTGPREVLSWEVGQKYFFDPTFGNALVPGERNVFASTVDLTGIAFLSERRPFSPLVSRLRIETSPRTNTEWDLDYDLKKGRINASTALLNYRYGPFTLGAGDAFLRVADLSLGQPLPGARDFHQIRILFGYGDLKKRGLSAATSFGFDANQGALQYATVQTTYNWDCCGLSLEYRRFALGSVRNENLYRFSFSLANVGAFGNLRRQERLY